MGELNMEIALPSQMREVDRIAIEEFGIPGIVLMENAAINVVAQVKRIMDISEKEIVILAGKGNNGGDAFATARHLYNKGAKVHVFLLFEKTAAKGNALTNLTILEKMGVEVFEATSEEALEFLKSCINLADIIIDGIFGTGITRQIKGIPYEVIRLVNESNKTVLSIDIPSGINGETGEIEGICIKADTTVTFGLPKPGLLCYPGREYKGKLFTVDIGIPDAAVGKAGIKTYLIDRGLVQSILPYRKYDSNKGDYGRIFVIGGSTGMTGACHLCSSAVLKAGGGLVYTGIPESMAQLFDMVFTEGITIPLNDNGKGYLTASSLKRINREFENKTVAALGPGLSMNEDTIKTVYGIIELSRIPLVIDADGLNAISKDISVLKKLKAEAVLTPHPGEMARLSGKTIKQIQSDRITAAREFSTEWKVITVLKGAGTIVSLPNGSVYVNATGNSGMATGGSGDVLTGVIAGLIGGGICPSDATVAGVYLHGLAGDLAAEKKGEHGITSKDILEWIPYALKDTISNRKLKDQSVMGGRGLI
jgi:ADP-dependent NAD(P)H-hydrate dehydratase / NAD(P)H-hydrate epimerase